MNRRPRRILCLMMALFMARLFAVHAADDAAPKSLLEKIAKQINYLAEPGDLSLSHSQIEKSGECARCHTFKTGLSVEKCLSCHKKIERRLKEKTGYHGTFTDKCWKCHTDHKGREARNVELDKGAFNHRQAAFSLKGFHQDVDCDACHNRRTANDGGRAKETFIGLPQTCRECHGDPHQGQISGNCEDCHNEGGWKSPNLSFDHATTSFTLTGKHAVAKCGACHGDGKFKFESTGCGECHAEPHRGQLGESCTQCHSENGWDLRSSLFDHARDARFKLNGQHRDLQCFKCHGAGHYKFDSFACANCHKDPHAGQFEKSCDHCHDESGWKGPSLLFQHNRDSQFELKGHHVGVQCDMCHDEGDYQFKSFACGACHKDPHKGQFKKTCTQCHAEEGWGGRFLLFDHAKDSHFELTGLHQGLNCKACHKQGRYASRESACGACHKEPHEGRFGSRCEKCHDTKGPWKTSWSRLGDHSKTRFPLNAMHDGLSCRSCHAEGTMATVGVKCEDCHRDVEDFYRGVLPQTLPENLALGALRSKPDPMHGKVPCAACHAPLDQEADLGAIVPRCVACHTPEYADYAASWTSLIIQEAHGARNAVGSAEGKKYIEQIERLSPHNFQFARQQLRALSKEK